MLYTVLDKKRSREIRTDSQANVSRGDRVWKTLREARTWRDQHEHSKGVFAVLADWDSEVKPVPGEKYGVLLSVFKVVQLEEIVPTWIKDMSSRIAEGASHESLLDDGYINPDYATPEQEEVYYSKHRDEIMFQLRCLTSLAVFEELEIQGMIWDEKKQRREDDGRQDCASSNPDLFRVT
jgi:hypothetical protein